MFIISKIRGISTAFAVILCVTFTGSLYAQQGSYSGNESKVQSGSLLSKANATDFGNNISATIFKDDKNTYYAVDLSKLPEKFERIRVLELSYGNKVLVNIGNDLSTNFLFYLVNNTLNKSTQYINDLFNDFLTQSKAELQTMNAEQLRLWLIQHDKYSTK